MARRPQRHVRQGSVVKSGPQAGVVRRGSVVNPDVVYDGLGSGGSGPGDVSSLIESDEVGGFGGGVVAGSEFVPERFRVLPEDPRDLFGEAHLSVSCCGGEHSVVVGGACGGGAPEVVLRDHDLVDDVVGALGGDVPVCFEVRELLRKRSWNTALFPNKGDVELPSFSTPGVRVGNHFVSGLDAGEGVVSGTDGESVHAELLARVSRAGAVRYVARVVAGAWLESFGAVPASPGRSHMYVNKQDDEIEVPGSVWYHFPSSKGKRPISVYGTWGEGENTRFVGNVNEDWYDDVRENGYLIQGRLNLGLNADGVRVVADIDPKSGDMYARVLEDGEVLPDLDEVLKQVRESREVLAEGFSIYGPDAFFVGSYASWEYNDEYYYQEEGGRAAAIFDNPLEARGWARFGNVMDSVFTASIRAGEYTDDGYNFPKGAELEMNPDCFDFMVAAANEKMSPANFAIAFRDWGAVSPPRD